MGKPRRMKSRLAITLMTSTLVAAALAIAACGGSNDATVNLPTPTSSAPSYTDIMGGSSPSATSSAVPLPTPTVAGTIVFAKMLNSAAGYDSDIYVVNTDGTGLKRLTRDGMWNDRPSWSPDGSRIPL